MKKIVLIVDDEERVRKAHADVVTSLGYDFELAYDGLDCLKKLETTKFNLIIMGIKMPKMDGVEALTRIAKAYEHLPVIIVSALIFENTEADLKELGAFAVFRKPVHLNDLVDAIEQALQEFH